MLSEYSAAYVKLLKNGQLNARAINAYQHLLACDGCARYCRVDRLHGELGECQIGEYAKISSFGPHHGEEDPLRGVYGSGTIFFTSCNLHCQYCQNFDISQTQKGTQVTSQDLAKIMLDLQSHGCHNINLVSPSHVVPQIIQAIAIAAKNGLNVPLVYNTGGYDSAEMLSLLDGIIDIYMPDMKYSDAVIGNLYSQIKNYPEVNKKAVKEMHRQVGDLQMDHQGIAQHGMLVRHLVLPKGLAGTYAITKFLAEEISVNTYINIMDQYRPTFKANQYPEINRPITQQEYCSAIHIAKQAGLVRLDRRILFGW